jgi:putative SOS response-associated peptidase YedK
MCGRYVSPDDAAIEREFNLVRSSGLEIPMNFNVAPSQNVPVVRMLRGARQLCTMRWGLVPFFAKGIPGPYSTINARIETIETAASYRGPWKRGQRCIIPAAGFYEWHLNDDGKKQPFYIRCVAQEVHGYAGLWESSTREDGMVIESCTIVTLPAHPMMAEIHNAPGKQRMPVILERKDYDAWLAGSLEEARAVLRQYPAGDMVAWPVGTRVNAPKNNDAALIEPLASQANLSL